MATLLPEGKQSFTNSAGAPLIGGKLYTYDAGTNNPRTTYQDSAATVPNSNPVVLDARGEATIFWAGAYKVVLKDATDSTIWTIDDVRSIDTYASSVDAALRSELGSNTNPTTGAGQIGFGALAYAAGTVGEKLRERVSVMDYIPADQHAGIRSGALTYDCTDAINSALAEAKIVYMPAGSYLVTRPINMTARRSGYSYWGRSLIGEGWNLTYIYGFTGNYPVIDTTGSSAYTIEGFNIRADAPFGSLTPSDCASIGILLRRGAGSQLGGLFGRIRQVRINLTSDMSRNGGSGTGTVGIINNSGEHIVGDHIEIYANTPLVQHNVLRFAIAEPSTLPTYGTQYELPYTGAPISCTIHEWRSLVLVSWDSFRAIWMDTCSNSHFASLYTSTRKMVSTTPANMASFEIHESQLVSISAYQEASGRFGATYRMDHAYVKLSGLNECLNIKVRRGPLDWGFALPAQAAPSIYIMNGTQLADSRIDVCYLIGVYGQTGDANGYAQYPINVPSGAPGRIYACEFVLDSLYHGANSIFAAAPNGIDDGNINVNCINAYTGENYKGTETGTFTPVIAGGATAGVGTYTAQIGKYQRTGRAVSFVAQLSWTAHTGTGFIKLTGLPLANTSTPAPATIYYSGLTAIAGKTVMGYISPSSTEILFRALDPAGGSVVDFAVDGTVGELVVSGTYLIP